MYEVRTSKEKYQADAERIADNLTADEVIRAMENIDFEEDITPQEALKVATADAIYKQLYREWNAAGVPYSEVEGVTVECR